MEWNHGGLAKASGHLRYTLSFNEANFDDIKDKDLEATMVEIRNVRAIRKQAALDSKKHTKKTNTLRPELENNNQSKK
jgi:hypothetical protein